VAVVVAFTISAAVAAGASTHPASNASKHPRSSAQPTLHFTLTAPRSAKPSATGPRKARTAVLPYRHAPNRQALGRQSLLNQTIPIFSDSVVAGQDGNTYGFTIVGQDPIAGGAGTTRVPVQVIPIIVTDGSSGDVYDPTVANGGCGEPVSPVTGMLTGPLLTNHRWVAGGRYVGTDQYVGATMREEFWAYANRFGISPSYHVRFSGSEPAVVSVTFNGGTEVNPGTCNQLEEFPISTWDSFVQGSLIPQLASFGVSSTTFPFFLFKNVVFTGGGCCILGYHSAFNSGGNSQTYGNGDYVTDGEFGGISDLAVPSHEISEWANDPFVNNPTPSWGHIGQVSGCQNNLETGDPLTGTDFAFNSRTTVGGGGPIYHLQELAFFGWFYDDNIGINGWFSSRGSFTSGATLCS
jgi:hypothetical protein